MVAILNFTKDLEIRLKPRGMTIFCALHEKYHTNKNFAGFQPQDYLLLLKEVEDMYLHPKVARPPATYDVISCNHSN